MVYLKAVGLSWSPGFSRSSSRPAKAGTPTHQSWVDGLVGWAESSRPTVTLHVLGGPRRLGPPYRQSISAYPTIPRSHGPETAIYSSSRPLILEPGQNMKAEIISIGSEITSGQNLDTNSQCLARRMAEIGIPAHFHTTVPDD